VPLSITVPYEPQHPDGKSCHQCAHSACLPRGRGLQCEQIASCCVAARVRMGEQRRRCYFMLEAIKHEQSVPWGKSEPATWPDILTAEETHSREELAVSIRENLLAHLDVVGLGAARAESAAASKEMVRLYHGEHRRNYRAHEAAFVSRFGRQLLGRHFADGSEVNPAAIDPVLIPVASESEESRVFRLATLLWSIPVSRGYGRRMRFLVRDRSNGKLIGLFALADPVFNLAARDTWIGWDVDDRRERLVNVMDAHVVGAVPPYAQLLGGKLVASLMTAREVTRAFSDKYLESEGQISHQKKHAQLVLITVTSALGRSSLYNRLRLPGTVDFVRVGMTDGWGHFHVPENVFRRMRRLLEVIGHKYASGHQYGDGPNWRMRVVRAALVEVGLDPDIMRHGVSRDVYAAPLAQPWQAFLRGETQTCDVLRPSAQDIAQQAIERWVIPRARRRPSFAAWTREDTWRLLIGAPPEDPAG
jgi:uncharacterized protein DUF4338